jgi:signal peptidase II
MKKSFLKYFCILCVVVTGLSADFYTKKCAFHHLKNKPLISAIPGVLQLGYIENRGMVFGILNRGDKPHSIISLVSWVRAAVCLAVSFFIVINRRMPFFFLLPFLVIWLGAVGNLIDTFSLGYVIDFIHIHAGKVLDWPFFFNCADAYVCIGAGLLFLNGFVYPQKNPTVAEVH